jgi:hypothetical protein
LRTAEVFGLGTAIPFRALFIAAALISAGRLRLYAPAAAWPDIVEAASRGLDDHVRDYLRVSI